MSLQYTPNDKLLRSIRMAVLDTEWLAETAQNDALIADMQASMQRINARLRAVRS
jgi:hypothetical protein